jgi:hypothetical protein
MSNSLPEELRRHLNKAIQHKKENKKFLTGFSKRKDVDESFHALHEDAFERIDCLTCANCCKTTSPIFRDVDIDRIAKHLGMRPSLFTEKYLHIDEDNDWVLNSSPCAFLGEDNYCSIYEVRPKACREYPHTNRKNMHQIMDLTYRNTMVCPAVASIVDKLRSERGTH